MHSSLCPGTSGPELSSAALDLPGLSLHNQGMKNKNGSSLHPFMLASLLSLVLVLTASSGDDILKRLGLTPQAAKEGILDALTGGSAYNDSAYRAFRALPAASRAAVVTAGLGWIKSYAAGAEFKAAYQKLRESEKPEAPASRPSADDELKKMKNETEKSIAEMKKNMAGMDAETRKAMEGFIQEMRAQLERMEKDPGQRDLMRQMSEMSSAEDRKNHEDALGEWQQRYPADPGELIQRRIREFLAVSAGVDFAARLMPRGDKMVFVREDFERKPPEWKLCFRAGKEATVAARSFASAWLAELEED